MYIIYIYIHMYIHMEDHKDGLKNVQLVMMGNGEPCYGDMFRWAESRCAHPMQL